jgi:hypothetical protein
MKPKASTPPKAPRAISRIGRLAVRLIRKGLRKLSTELTASAPHSTMKMAQPLSPCWYSQKAAPPQISGGPTGTSDRKKVPAASSSAPGTPAITKPTRATRAWAAAVPTMPIITALTVLPASSSSSPPARRPGAPRRFRAGPDARAVAVEEEHDEQHQRDLQQALAEHPPRPSANLRAGSTACRASLRISSWLWVSLRT